MMLYTVFIFLIVALATPFSVLQGKTLLFPRLINELDSPNAPAQGVGICTWIPKKLMQTCFLWPQTNVTTFSPSYENASISSSGVMSLGTAAGSSSNVSSIPTMLTSLLQGTSSLTTLLQSAAMSIPSTPAASASSSSAPLPAAPSYLASPPTPSTSSLLKSRSTITKTVNTTVNSGLQPINLSSLLSAPIPSFSKTTTLPSAAAPTVTNETSAQVGTCIWIRGEAIQTCFPWPQRGVQRRVVDSARFPDVWQGLDRTFVTRVRTRTVVA